jgi:hypothetical protein
LIRAGRSIPVSYSACAPKAPPPLLDAPALFPDYRLSRDAALSFGLEREVFSRLANLQGSVESSQAVELTFRDTSAQVMADQDLAELVTKPECRDAIAASEVVMVRGYILGKRHFTLSGARNAGAAISVGRIGNMTLAPDKSGERLTVSDSGKKGFLQVISAVTLPAAGTAPLKVDRPEVVNIPAAAEAGRVYVQRDRADSPARAQAVLRALIGADFNVIPQVEALDSGKVPLRAQVRYFRDEDSGRAEAAAAALKELFPEIGAVRISLPGPPGQLEVWMPRAVAENGG